MGDEMRITYEMKRQVIEKLWLRSWLFAMLCITAGFSYLAVGDPQVQEAVFLLFCLLALWVISFAIWCKERYMEGMFGLNYSDQRFISSSLTEENHWWGKPLFATHFVKM